MRVLVLTQYDDGVGPMVAAFLRDYSTCIEVVSVGKRPKQSIHPLAVITMRECLIDLEDYVPKSISEVDDMQFDLVKEWPEMSLPDDLNAFRVFRDEVKNESFIFYRDVLRK